MNQVIMIIMAAGAILGGADLLLGGRWGYGDKFESGLMLIGSMALSMAGIICLTPAATNLLARVIVPFYKAIGVDPAMFGGILAIDMGGYGLAKNLAVNARIGSYAGVVVSSIFGCTLIFTVPAGMGIISEDDREYFARGIMIGLAVMPVGLAVGGILSGIGAADCLLQNIPILVPALFLLIGLKKNPAGMIKGFCLLAGGIRRLTTAGLILAAVEFMTGKNPVPGMVPIEEAMKTVSSIGVMLLGSLPIAELMRRILERPLTRLGELIGFNRHSLTGMMIGLVSALPALAMYKDMNNRGKVAVGAFLVSGTGLLAAHMAFTLSIEPEMMGALAAAKFSGALAAVALTAAMCKKSAEF